VSKVADDFAAWYAHWLDDSLVDAAEKRAFYTLWFDPHSKPQPETVQVIELVDRLGAQYPDWTNQHYLRGVLQMYNRNVNAASEHLARAIEVAPADLRPRIMLGRLHTLLDEDAEAVAVADRALALDVVDVPNQYRLHWLRARALLKLNQPEAAIEAAARARDLQFYVFYNQIDYAIFLTTAGQADRAAAALQEYIEQAHGDEPIDAFSRQVYQAMADACDVWSLPEAATAYQSRLA
jgi:tetratricopeptide (TPR) repeat protein